MDRNIRRQLNQAAGVRSDKERWIIMIGYETVKIDNRRLTKTVRVLLIAFAITFSVMTAALYKAFVI